MISFRVYKQPKPPSYTCPHYNRLDHTKLNGRAITHLLPNRNASKLTSFFSSLRVPGDDEELNAKMLEIMKVTEKNFEKRSSIKNHNSSASLPEEKSKESPERRDRILKDIKKIGAYNNKFK